MEKTKRVFVLGNGATLSCEKNFYDFIEWGINKSRTILKKNNNSDDCEIAKQIIACYDNIKTFDFCKSHDICCHDIAKIIECISKSQCSLNHFQFPIQYTSGNPIELVYNLQLNITVLLSLLYKRKIKNTCYYNFAKLLNKDDIIVNLNWDNLFEMAYRKATNLEPKHLLSKNLFKIKIEKKSYTNSCKLVKPHGSIEYRCCQTDVKSTVSGCFRISITPNHILYSGDKSNEEEKCLFYEKGCNNHLNLKQFIVPYTKLERTFFSFPFSRMIMENLKQYIKHDGFEIICIGYSFKKYNDTWIDEDLYPLFIRAKKIKIIGKDYNDAKNIEENITTIMEQKKGKTIVTSYNGFDDYLKQSKQKGRLL